MTINTGITNQELNNIDNNLKKIEIKIDVYDKSCITCSKKSIFIIISILILISLIVFLIVHLILKKSKDIEPSPTIPTPTDTNIEKSNQTNPTSNDTIIETSNPTNPTDTNIETSNPTICENGYFIPDDDKTLKDCKKCSLEGCEKCNGTYKENECNICGNNLKPVYKNNKIIKCNDPCETGEEDKCLICSNKTNQCEKCNIGYILKDGTCKINYLIKAIYESKYSNERVVLISNYLNSISQMIIDGKNVTPSTYYTFGEISDHHIIYFSFKKTIISTSTYIFSGITRLKEIYFTDFNEYDPYIPDINFKGMFNKCTNLVSFDFQNLI